LKFQILIVCIHMDNNNATMGGNYIASIKVNLYLLTIFNFTYGRFRRKST